MTTSDERRDAMTEPARPSRSRGAATTGGARPGRPLEMSAAQVLARVRELSAARGLFRAHRAHPALYARARRLFGSWAAAVRTAGLDYERAIDAARARATEARRRNRRLRIAPQAPRGSDPGSL